MKYLIASLFLFGSVAALAGNPPAGKKCPGTSTYSNGSMCTAPMPKKGCKDIAENCHMADKDRCSCGLVDDTSPIPTQPTAPGTTAGSMPR